MLSDVYEPTVDNTNVGTLQYVVTDGSTFTDLQTRDLTYTVSADPSGMACTVTATSATHGYRLVTTYATDPSRDTVLMRMRLERSPGSHTDLRALHVYARLDAHVNGNGGGGDRQRRTRHRSRGSRPRLFPSSTTRSVTSQAANRDYAVPTYMALRSTAPAQAASVGYAGTASDGLTQLDASHALTTRYTSAPDGHIIATEDVTPAGAGQSGAAASSVTLALGFGRTSDGAVDAAGASLRQPFGSVLDAYQSGWQAYDAGLNPPPGQASRAEQDAKKVNAAYYLSANVLKASEDKTFPGAIVASLASPWGQAVNAGTVSGGKAVYFGSYREVFSRDLYEVFTGLLVDGDLATARAAARFLLESQQLPSGEIPRNSLLNGKAAPDTGGDQLDETSYPILMAYQAGLGGDATLWRQHIIPAADFLVAHGPSFGVERWEEQSGYSPSTIAAEIAGLTAAAAIASQQGDSARAQLYQATADQFQRMIKTWTVTTTGPDGPQPYFIRLSKNGDPNAAISYGLGNGGPTLDQRAVLDGGFQELVRLGELPASDPDVQASLHVWDNLISVKTPSGIGYYRYGNDAAKGSADGYGDCYQPSQTSCTTQGQPWPTTNTGTGHLWPVLSGERAESDIGTADLNGAAGLLMRNDRLLVRGGPRARAGLGESGAGRLALRNRPDRRLHRFHRRQARRFRRAAVLGTGAGTAAHLRSRHRAHPGAAQDHRGPVRAAPPPAAVPITLTAPADGSHDRRLLGHRHRNDHAGRERRHRGHGHRHRPARHHGDRDRRRPTARSPPRYPIGFGTNVLTVTAAAGGGTGYAQVAVVGGIVGGKTVLDVTDPPGDDNGPGTYQYPTSSRLRRRLLRHHPLPGDHRGLAGVPADHAEDADADVRQPDRRATARHLRPLPRRRDHVDRRAVHVAQLHDRAGRRVEPAARGTGLRRSGLGGRGR